jgi:hypothetical protein
VSVACLPSDSKYNEEVTKGKTMAISKRKARKLRKEASRDGIAVRNGKPIVVPLPDIGKGHVVFSGAGKHENKKRKKIEKLRRSEEKDYQ